MIGKVGRTGTTYFHLHFEIARDATGSYAVHAGPTNRRVDPYAIEDIAAFYPPPPANCSNVKRPADYLWTACPLASRMDDNFNDNCLDPTLWSLLVPPPGLSGAVVETNQRLEISLGAGFGGVGIVSMCQLLADFDVQVDYILLNWPTTNLHSVRLGAPDLGVGPGGGVGLNRSSFPNGGTGEFYLISLPSIDPQIPAGQLFGKLRLVRSGSTMSGFIMDGTGNWALVGSGTVPTAAIHISLDLGSGSSNAQGGVSAAFDNFKVNAGTISCPQ